MRFLLFVEGDLEYKTLPGLLRRWLAPRLSRPAGIDIGWNSRGCGAFLDRIGSAAKHHLDSRRAQDVIAAIGLIDLKGPEDHGFYPKEMTTARDRYQWGVQEITRRVDHPKFKMHFAMHEFEAWLLSQPEIFPTSVQPAIAGIAADPESVDFDEGPACRIEHAYQEQVDQGRLKYRYGKIRHGVGLFSQLDPERAYEKCPHLKALLDDMLDLAKKAGM